MSPEQKSGRKTYFVPDQFFVVLIDIIVNSRNTSTSSIQLHLQSFELLYCSRDAYSTVNIFDMAVRQHTLDHLADVTHTSSTTLLNALSSILDLNY